MGGTGPAAAAAAAALGSGSAQAVRAGTPAEGPSVGVGGLHRKGLAARRGAGGEGETPAQ